VSLFHLNLWIHAATQSEDMRAIVIAKDDAIEIIKLIPMPNRVYFQNPSNILNLRAAVKRKLNLSSKTAITLNLGASLLEPHHVPV